MRRNPEKVANGTGMPAIVVDSREQAPYDFAGAVRATLASGDYSLAGLEGEVAIERKSLDDAYGSLAAGRERFRREVERLAALNYSAIVVEATVEEFLGGASISRMDPKSALNSLMSWSVELGVPVWFAGPRWVARGVVYNLLRHYWRSREKLVAKKIGEQLVVRIAAVPEKREHHAPGEAISVQPTTF